MRGLLVFINGVMAWCFAALSFAIPMLVFVVWAFNDHRRTEIVLNCLTLCSLWLMNVGFALFLMGVLRWSQK